MALLTLVISSLGSDCIKWERKLKKGGTRCKHRPPPKMTHQQDLTKSQKSKTGIFCPKLLRIHLLTASFHTLYIGTHLLKSEIVHISYID